MTLLLAYSKNDYILQNSVATRLRWVRIFNDFYIANLLQSRYYIDNTVLQINKCLLKASWVKNVGRENVAIFR